MRRIKIATLLLFTLLTSCLKEEAIKLNNGGHNPKTLPDGLNTSTPEAQAIDNSALDKAYNLFFSNKLPLSKGLIVMRNGFLVSEAYAQDLNDLTKIDNIQSCTKSITALLIGIAIKDGLIESVNDPIYKYLPEYFDNDIRKREISIRNCLSLQAGLASEGNKDSENMVNLDGSSLKFVLSKPMIADTGTIFQYSDLVPQLLAGVLQKVTPNGVEAYADKKLFQPLGIKKYKWEKTKDGINIGAFSMFFTTRDLAKLGQVCLNNGSFNDIQVIDKTWIDISSKKQALNESYGYGFYVQKDAFTMRGNGGQFVYINPSKHLVISYTASPYTGPELWGSTNELIDLIVSSCK